MATQRADHLKQAQDFDVLVHGEQAALYRYCYMLTGSHHDAEDLVQDTWLKVYSSYERVKQASKPKAYIRKMASNRWTDKNRGWSGRMDPLDKVALLAEPDPFETKEALELLIRCVPPRGQAAVLLTEVLEFTNREAAELLGTSEGAIKALLSRARTTLRNCVVETEPGVAARIPGGVVEAFWNALECGHVDEILRLAGQPTPERVVGTAESMRMTPKTAVGPTSFGSLRMAA